MAGFTSAQRKLQDARGAIRWLEQSTNSNDFEAAFYSSIAHLRAVTYALQKQGAHVDRFDEWYAERQEAMRSDALMRFVHDVRVDDFHKGESVLVFPLSTTTGGVLHDFPKGASGLVVNSRGAFYQFDEGTPQERWEPAPEFTGVVHVALKEPPSDHLGQPVSDPTPLGVCRAALAFLEQLVHDARQQL